jgi:DNA-binding XRE family transcriptional regulator
MRCLPIEQLEQLVGRNMHLLRIRAKLSQSALGKSVGVTFQQIQKYEWGRTVSQLHGKATGHKLKIKIMVIFEPESSSV